MNFIRNFAVSISLGVLFGLLLSPVTAQDIFGHKTATQQTSCK